MTLRDCRPGHEVLLQAYQGAHHGRVRLAELGFLPGARLRVIARGAAGGLIVALGDARVALDARTSRALVVERAG